MEKSSRHENWRGLRAKSTERGVAKENDVGTTPSVLPSSPTDAGESTAQEEKDEDDDERVADADEEEVEQDFIREFQNQLGFNRQLVLQGMYYGCLFLMLAALSALCAFGVLSIMESVNAASDCNVAGRQRFTMQRIIHFARELILTQPQEFLMPGSFTINSTDQIRNFLTVSAQAFLISHTAMLYGSHAGWVDYPQAHGWSPLTYTNPQSCFSPFESTFEEQKQSPGGYENHQYIPRLYFEATCWSDLYFKDEVSDITTHPRVVFFAQDYNPSKCIFFQQGDVLLKQGLHQMIERFGMRALALAKTPASALSDTNPDFQFLDHYDSGSPEMQLGIGMAVLLYEYEALTKIQKYVPFMIAFDVCVCLFILIQYRILGSKAPEILSHNVSMGTLVTRLISHSKSVLTVKPVVPIRPIKVSFLRQSPTPEPLITTLSNPKYHNIILPSSRQQAPSSASRLSMMSDEKSGFSVAKRSPNPRPQRFVKDFAAPNSVELATPFTL